MSKIAPFAATLLLCCSAASEAKSPAPAPSRARGNLALYISDEDYPADAIRNKEQGVVGFQLQIDGNGLPTSCSVTSSSGSPTLDAATCRIMTERPRFQPARDARGRAVPDHFSTTLNWVLPDELTGAALRVQTAQTLWSDCIEGEIAKLIPSKLTAAQIAQRAFQSCEPLEALLAKEVGGSVPLTDPRTTMQGDLDETIQTARAELNSPDDPATPEPQP